jgi:hypothetical protein
MGLGNFVQALKSALFGMRKNLLNGRSPAVQILQDLLGAFE